MPPSSNAAVVVNGACKNYNKQVVLLNLNMRVDKGTIYGLLGPSGCGKTTLLSCIVGVRSLNAGSVWVLGGKPGSRKSGVPGPRVGYMPQDIALVPEFTVKEAVYYFGRIFALPKNKMRERFNFLSELLELPPPNRFVKNCSGGQQRRVSFASALVQDAELLILDEPTVGLDPVLREKIWSYMVELTTNTDTAVIITTHYIEETKMAHKIGLMRGGKLLAEQSPNSLLLKYGTETLEDVFLLLSVKQSQDEKEIQNGLEGNINPALAALENNHLDNSTNLNNYDSREDFGRMNVSSTDALTEIENKPKSKYNDMSSWVARYRALMVKDIQKFIRHPGGLFFSGIFPIIQVLAFFAAVGHDPRILYLAVINNEVSDVSMCHNTSLKTVQIEDDLCTFNHLSCRFMDIFDEATPAVQKMYLPPEEARHRFEHGKIIAEIHFSQNFSKAIYDRLEDPPNDDPDIINFSNVEIYIDTTDFQLSTYLKKELYDAYDEFSRSIARDCNSSSDRAGSLPISFKEPIYGTKRPSYTHYMAPGLLVTILFFLSTTTTSTIMISERLEGVWDRSIVAGVKPREILLCHVFLQAAISTLQTIELMCLTFYVFDVPAIGSLVTTGILLFSQGLGGMAFGFLLSVLSSSYTMSFYLASGSFYPMILLCGILWPIESMPSGLWYVSMCLPFTIPTAAVREILHKGYAFTDFEVYTGFMVSIAWFVGLILLCIFILRCRK